MIIANAKNLLAALKGITHFCRNNIRPVYPHNLVLLFSREGNIGLTAFSGGSITATYRLFGEADETERFLVPLDVLLQAATFGARSDQTIAIERDGAEVVTTVGLSSWRTSVLDEGNFPSLTLGDPLSSCLTDAGSLRDGISYVWPMASNDTTRGPLQSVAFVLTNVGLTLAASDGYRLSEYLVGVSDVSFVALGGSSRANWLLRWKEADYVCRLLPLEGYVEVRVCEAVYGQLWMELRLGYLNTDGDTLTVAVQVSTEPFVNYRQFFPKDAPQRWAVAAGDLLTALKSLPKPKSKEMIETYTSFAYDGNGRLMLSYKGEQGSISTPVSVFGGPDGAFTSHFDRAYMQHFLSLLNRSRGAVPVVSVHMPSPTHAALLTVDLEPSLQHLLMPMTEPR